MEAYVPNRDDDPLCPHPPPPLEAHLIAIFSLSIAMALGIGALSVSNTLLVLPPSAPEPDRLINLYSRSQINSIEHISYPDYQYLRQRLPAGRR